MNETVPNGWLAGLLEDFLVFQRGYDITEKQAVSGDVPVISSSGVSYYHNKAMVQPPGVVTGRKGILGKVHYIDVPYWPHDTTLWIKDFKGNEPRFAKYFLEWFHLARFDAATSVPTLNRNVVHVQYVKFPSLPEQRKIAEILSTCDKTIDLTEQLIAAKQRRKKGIMQLMLSGKLRFPEFEGDDWKELELKDVVKINQNNLPESSNPEKEYYYIDLSAVDAGAIHLPTQKQRFGDLPSRARRVLHPNDIIMATVRPHLLGYARCTFDTTETLCSTGFAVITPNKPEYIDFIYQSLYSSGIQQQIAALVTGSNYPAINASQVGKLKMAWPLSDQERRKVANLLTLCDDEIDFLQQKFTTLKSQKQGLMQQLLTGKIRVKV